MSGLKSSATLNEIIRASEYDADPKELPQVDRHIRAFAVRP